MVVINKGYNHKSFWQVNQNIIVTYVLLNIKLIGTVNSASKARSALKITAFQCYQINSEFHGFDWAEKMRCACGAV